MLRTALLVPLLLVGLVSFVFIRGHQGDGSTVVVRQQHAQALTAPAVARVVRAAPDGLTGARGTAATCVPLGAGELLNPWRCLISYRSGRQIQYLVTIHADGSYRGDHELVSYRGRRHLDTGMITGCCVSIP